MPKHVIDKTETFFMNRDIRLEYLIKKKFMTTIKGMVDINQVVYQTVNVRNPRAEVDLDLICRLLIEIGFNAIWDQTWGKELLVRISSSS